MGRESSEHGKMRNRNKILFEKTERKRPLGRPRHRWKIKTDMSTRERGLDCVD
jgi:hypothetical protein